MTNGLGGFACGTIAGANTRRYHGFLVASLNPPVQRTLLVAKVELSVHYLGVETDLSANEFADGAISGQLPRASGSSMPSQATRVEPLRPA